MIRIFVNGLAASSGAGLTYLHNVVPHLSKLADVHTIVAVQPELKNNFGHLASVEVVSPLAAIGPARRFFFEQWRLPRLIREKHADVLISAGNFAVRNSPVPQILLSGNSLYTSREFSRDLWARHEFGMLAGNFVRGILARKSVHWAECTLAPSAAFADDLSRWSGKDVAVLPHGFDRATFCQKGKPLASDIQEKLARNKDALRLLFVSHYNYYRNFETLLRALPFIQRRLGQREIRLILTCKLEAGAKAGGYETSRAARLVAELGLSRKVVQLGPVPYESLHQLYSACDLYVTAAYAETFAHPLVEAMASELPIVASDLRVHREVCGNAALYFDTFSPESLAEQVANAGISLELRSKLISAGVQRATDFSWAAHVEQLTGIAKELCSKARKDACVQTFRLPRTGSVTASPR